MQTQKSTWLRAFSAVAAASAILFVGEVRAAPQDATSRSAAADSSGEGTAQGDGADSDSDGASRGPSEDGTDNGAESRSEDHSGTQGPDTVPPDAVPGCKFRNQPLELLI